MLPLTQLSLQCQGNRAGKKLHPTRIRVNIVILNKEEKAYGYERLMRIAFKCKRADYSFIDADYRRKLPEDSEEYPIYVKCALINLLKDGNTHVEELVDAIKVLEKKPSVANADRIIEDLYYKVFL